MEIFKEASATNSEIALPRHCGVDLFQYRL